MPKHWLSLSNVDAATLAAVVDHSLEQKKNPEQFRTRLAGRSVGIYFNRPSTRTRTSFTLAAAHQGAAVVTYGPNDLQTTTGETIGDTTRILGGYLDALVIRTHSTAEAEQYAAPGRMSIVNALTEEEHPSQAVADLMTMKEVFGQLKGLHVLFLGDGGNIAASLVQAVARTPGMKISVVTPKEYGLKPAVLREAEATAKANGATVVHHHDSDAFPTDADVVYATRWRSMGQDKPQSNWQDLLTPYRADQKLLDRVMRSKDAIFMHDLPAERGMEVTDDVLDGARSQILEQARNKYFSGRGILSWCLT
jgi:ornithine carbamoyltransferase